MSMSTHIVQSLHLRQGLNSTCIQHGTTCTMYAHVHDGQHDKYLNNLTMDGHMYMYMYTYKTRTIGYKAVYEVGHNMYML